MKEKTRWYTVLVRVEGEDTYEIEAESEEQAMDLAIEAATDDLNMPEYIPEILGVEEEEEKC